MYICCQDNKENKENRDASADRLDGRRGVTSSMDAQAGVVSEALSNNSSGRGTFTEQQARLSRVGFLFCTDTE